MKILQRLREPSTWAGMTGLLIALGISADLANAMIGVLGSTAALLAILLPEKHD